MHSMVCIHLKLLHNRRSINSTNDCSCIESCLPIVPEKGTVGASGDLAPLAHIALGLIGKGDMWSPSTGRESAKKVNCSSYYRIVA